MTSSVVLGTASVRHRGRRVLPMTTCEALTPARDVEDRLGRVVTRDRVPGAAQLLGEPAQRRQSSGGVAR